jgi:DNA polymerase I
MPTGNNPRPLIFDIETNGLLDELDRVHLLVIKDMADGSIQMYRRNDVEDTIEVGLRRLMEATQAGRLIAGHNVIKFDIPAIKKVYPWWHVKESRVRDTLVLSRLMFPDLWDNDQKLRKQGKLPGHLMGRYSLEAFGYRLGNFKGDYSGKWNEWNQEMEDYCYQDGHVTGDLWDKLESKEWDPRSVLLETKVAFILARQERHGFLFDPDGAAKLYSTLVKERLRLTESINAAMGPRYLTDGKLESIPGTPYRGHLVTKSRSVQQENLGPNPKAPIYKGRGSAKYVAGYKLHTFDYTEGAPYTPIKHTPFNSSSRQHIALWFKRKYGWEPDEFTPDGAPKVDDEVLNRLPFPEARKLRDYLLVEKRIGQLAEGNEAWMRRVGDDGRLHGSVITNGAVTGRMTHSKPNMGQVPSSKALYGPECRALFCVPRGKVLVGCDADALELRDLAGFMARYDNGEYIRTVLEGDKSRGTDMHSVNARALGLDPKKVYRDGETGRDIAKTWFYAFIYGAGDEKLGYIILNRKGDEARKAGAKSKKSFMKSLPALGELVKAVRHKVKTVGHLVGLDGRLLKIRSPHAALNTLLQSAGAVQMKMALVILDEALQQDHGLVPGKDYEFVANVHDEWQMEVTEGLEKLAGEAAADSIRRSGEFFGFRCPLAGNYEVGRNWAETH